MFYCTGKPRFPIWQLYAGTNLRSCTPSLYLDAGKEGMIHLLVGSYVQKPAGKENKRRLQTLSIDNAWSNKNFLVYLTFRMLQHTSSEVNGYNCYKHLKIQK